MTATTGTPAGHTDRSAPTKVRPPLAREVVKAVAIEHGVCIRPVAMRRTDLTTGGWAALTGIGSTSHDPAH